LVNRTFWSGLLEWIRTRLIEEGAIGKSDLNLFTVVETADQVHSAIKNFYNKKKDKKK